MSAITQYIDLYKEHRAAIEGHSAAAMNALRPAALDVLLSTPLPRRGDEGYARFSLEDAFAPDYGVNINRMAFPAEASQSYRCDIPQVSTLMAAVSGDMLVRSAYMDRNMPQGLTVTTIAEAARLMPETVERHYGMIAPLGRPEVALNTLLAQEGVMIHVARGAEIAKPVQIVNLLNSAMPMMAVRRVLIVAEEGASVQVLSCDHTSNNDTDYLASQVIEIYCGAGARVAYYDLEESSERTTRVSGLFVRQEQGSELTVNGSTLMGGTTRNDYVIDLAGERCSTSLAGMVIASGKQVTDNASLINHGCPHCHSDQLFKYVIDDEAKCAFEGAIKVDYGAKFTEAYQSNRNLLASKGARMHTSPQLEIYCDEVKCSHGATTGQLDESALFYMRSRGIPEDEARTMLMQAFMMDVLDTVKMDGLRDRLRHLVERRLSGHKAVCADCDAATDPLERTEGGRP